MNLAWAPMAKNTLTVQRFWDLTKSLSTTEYDKRAMGRRLDSSPVRDHSHQRHRDQPHLLHHHLPDTMGMGLAMLLPSFRKRRGKVQPISRQGWDKC